MPPLNSAETHCIYLAKCSVVLLSKTTATTIHNNSLWTADNSVI